MNLDLAIRTLALALCLPIAGCGGGGSGTGDSGGNLASRSLGSSVPAPRSCAGIATPPLPDRKPTRAEASRFLTQATFGPTKSEMSRVASIGYEAWMKRQFTQRASSHLRLYRARSPREPRDPRARQSAWWQIAVTSRDALRQRVAFALSEIFVVSEQGSGLYENQEGLTYYYDLLVNGAFGSYRELLETVTLSPVMGSYLSMLSNPKPDTANGLRSDENFAREVMQLFSIGTVQLNLDGTVKRDAAGNALPTYTQDDIVNLARALTGWSWKGASDFHLGPRSWTTQMTAFRPGGRIDGPGEFHDTGAKTLVGGTYLPPGLTAEQDLEMALDALARHPNVPPFISRQLIQRLVTSNPTPDYVRRVATVFQTSGGNLGSTVQAILLDPEARLGPDYLGPAFGKVREPLLRMTQLWRAFDGRASRLRFDSPRDVVEQSAVSAPSVFNFFSPTHAPAFLARGVAADPCAPVAPELQLAHESSLPRADNLIFNAMARHRGPTRITDTGVHNVRIRLTTETRLAKQATQDALVEHLNVLLMGGRMDAELRSQVTAYLNTLPAGEPDRRAAEAAYLVLSSPQNLVQR
ncbi:MAG: DUF1800 domain-containing protein [Panacagrimonas sp.]